MNRSDIPPDVLQDVMEGLPSGKFSTVGAILARELQGRTLENASPLQLLLAHYKARARDAMIALCTCDAEHTAVVLLAQNEVARYCETVRQIDKWMTLGREEFDAHAAEESEQLRKELGIQPDEGTNYEGMEV